MTEVPPLRCPACGGRLSGRLGTAGHGYMSYEVFEGFECLTCDTEWDKHGDVSQVYEATLLAATGPDGPAAQLPLEAVELLTPEATGDGVQPSIFA